MIEIRDCSKSFGAVRAVNQVSLEIGEREVFGLVGSNGAGKSTLLRMIAGILKPDEGVIQVDEKKYMITKRQNPLFFISQTTAIFQLIIRQEIWRIFTDIIIRSLMFRDFRSLCGSLAWMTKRGSAVILRA